MQSHTHPLLFNTLDGGNVLEIKKLRARKTAVAFRMSRQQDDLETLGGFVQDGGDADEADGVGVGEDVVQDD